METKEKNQEIRKAEELDKTFKKQATSKSYLVRAFGLNITKLKETGLINEENHEKLKEIHKKVVEQYIGQQLL